MRNVIIDKRDTNEWFIHVWKSWLTSVSQDSPLTLILTKIYLPQEIVTRALLKQSRQNDNGTPRYSYCQVFFAFSEEKSKIILE